MLVSHWSRFAAPALATTVAWTAAAQPSDDPETATATATDSTAVATGSSEGAPFGMLLAGGATLGLVPGVAPVVRVATDARLRDSTRWRLGLLHSPGDDILAGERKVSARLTIATASACARMTGRDDAHVLGCAGVVVGSLYPVTYVPQRTSFGAQTWGGVRLDVGYALQLSDRFWVEGTAVALAPVARWQHLDEAGNGVFTQPWFIPSLELAVGIRFGQPDRPAANKHRPVPTAPRVDKPQPANDRSDEMREPPQLHTLGGERTPSGPQLPKAAPKRRARAPRGEPLHSDDIQRTVSRYTRAVRDRCWEPAFDLRDSDAPRAARVSVTVTVAPNGTVSHVTGSGDPAGYPGLGRCITSEVERWKFPTATGETVVDVPFVFAAR